MEIKVNNQSHQVSKSTLLSQLLLQLNVENTSGMAIAVNNNVVPRARWEKMQLNNGDDILLIKATQGG